MRERLHSQAITAASIRQEGRGSPVLGALLLIQAVTMSLTSALFAAHPPIILAGFLVTAVPALAICVANAETYRLLPLLIWGAGIFLTLCIGYLLNPLSADPAVKVLIVFLVFAFGWMGAEGVRASVIAKSFVAAGAAGFIATAALLYREGLSAYFEEGERLTGGDESHPNLVGLTMVCVTLCGACSTNLVLRYVYLAMSLGVSSVVQSRNALMALIIIMAVFVWRDFIRHLSVVGIAVAFLIAVLALGLSFEPLAAAISNLFQLDNPYRGSDSNLVGRGELWQATWELFTEYPIFGFGLGQHQVGANIEMYAHNMYLIVLSESGQVGFIAFVAATLIAARGLTLAGRQASAAARQLTFALALALLIYYAYGVFEGRAVNAGNFLSYIFFFAWGYGIRSFHRIYNEQPIETHELPAQSIRSAQR